MVELLGNTVVLGGGRKTGWLWAWNNFWKRETQFFNRLQECALYYTALNDVIK